MGRKSKLSTTTKETIQESSLEDKNIEQDVVVEKNKSEEGNISTDKTTTNINTSNNDETSDNKLREKTKNKRNLLIQVNSIGVERIYKLGRTIGRQPQVIEPDFVINNYNEFTTASLDHNLNITDIVKHE